MSGGRVVVAGRESALTRSALPLSLARSQGALSSYECSLATLRNRHQHSHTRASSSRRCVAPLPRLAPTAVNPSRGTNMRIQDRKRLARIDAGTTKDDRAGWQPGRALSTSFETSCRVSRALERTGQLGRELHDEACVLELGVRRRRRFDTLSGVPSSLFSVRLA